MSFATFRSALTLGMLLATGSPTAADTVKLHGKPAFHHVHVSDFRDGRVVFRGVSGQYLRKPLAQVEWVKLDACPPLGVAERAAARGRWTLAIAAYQQALDEAATSWVPDLVRFRLLSTYDRAGRFADAVAVYVELLEHQGAADDAAAPRHPGPPGSATNARALTRLRQALANTESAIARRHLEALLFELRLYEGLDARAAETGGPPDTATQRSPILSLPMPARKTRPVRLSNDSFLLSAAESALDKGQTTRAVNLLEHALPHVDPAGAGPWRLLLGRARLGAGRPADAAADLLHLAETTRDSALAAAALYYVGIAHEQMGQADVAAQLYRQLLGREDTPADVRRDAADALKRLGQ